MRRLILLCLCMLFFACGNQDELINRVSELEMQNKILRDSLQKLAVIQVYSSEIIVHPESAQLDLQKKNKFVGYLVEHQKYLKYNLYKTDTTHYTSGANRELIASGLKDYKFNFEFTPKKRKENWIHILAEFDLDSVKVQIPGIVVMDAK